MHNYCCNYAILCMQWYIYKYHIWVNLYYVHNIYNFIILYIFYLSIVIKSELTKYINQYNNYININYEFVFVFGLFISLYAPKTNQ